MRLILFFTLFMAVFNIACVEDFDLNINNDDLKIVIDGLITNESGPYFVRLIYSSNAINEYPDGVLYDDEKPVMNAQVVISDDCGQIDTLMPIDINPDDYSYDYSLGNFKVVYDSIYQQYDTLILKHPIEYRHDRGFYKTNSIVGIPNRRYKLAVIVNDNEYVAYDYMMEVPSIDSLGYSAKISEAGGESYIIPKVYFKEPQDQDNYYLFEFLVNYDYRFQICNDIWRYSVLSDEYLESYVNGLHIDDGASSDGFEYYPFYPGDTIRVRMSSLSSKAYNYFENLIGQFVTDGGAYKPTPASPPTNLSNGALGFFRASAVTNESRLIE